MVIVSILPSQLSQLKGSRSGERSNLAARQKKIEAETKIEQQRRTNQFGFSRGGEPIDPSSLEGRIIKRQLKEQKKARKLNKQQKNKIKKIRSLKFGKQALESGLGEQIQREGGVKNFVDRVTGKVDDPKFTFGATKLKDGKLVRTKGTRGKLKTPEGRANLEQILARSKTTTKSKASKGPKQTVKRQQKQQKQLDQVTRPTTISTIKQPKTTVKRQRQTSKPRSVFTQQRSIQPQGPKRPRQPISIGTVPFADPSSPFVVKAGTGIAKGALNTAAGIVEFGSLINPERILAGREPVKVKRQGVSTIETAISSPFVTVPEREKQFGALQKQTRQFPVQSFFAGQTELSLFAGETLLGGGGIIRSGAKVGKEAGPRIIKGVKSIKTKKPKGKRPDIQKQRATLDKSLQNLERTTDPELTSQRATLQRFAQTVRKEQKGKPPKLSGKQRKEAAEFFKSQPKGIRAGTPENIFREIQKDTTKAVNVQKGGTKTVTLPKGLKPDLSEGRLPSFGFRGKVRTVGKGGKGPKKGRGKSGGSGRKLKAVTIGTIGASSLTGFFAGQRQQPTQKQKPRQDVTQGVSTSRLVLQPPKNETAITTKQESKQDQRFRQAFAIGASGQPNIPASRSGATLTGIAPRLAEKPKRGTPFPTPRGLFIFRGGGGAGPRKKSDSDLKFFRVFDVARKPFGPIKVTVGFQEQSFRPIQEIRTRARRKIAIRRPKSISKEAININKLFKL